MCCEYCPSIHVKGAEDVVVVANVAAAAHNSWHGVANTNTETSDNNMSGSAGFLNWQAAYGHPVYCAVSPLWPGMPSWLN